MVTAGSPVLYLEGQKEYGDIKPNIKSITSDYNSDLYHLIKSTLWIKTICGIDYMWENAIFLLLLCFCYSAEKSDRQSILATLCVSANVSSPCYTIIPVTSTLTILFPDFVRSQLSRAGNSDII